MTERRGVFLEKDARFIAQTVRAVAGVPGKKVSVDTQGPGELPGLVMHYAKLTSSLSAASAFLTGDTTATALLVKRADADDLEAGTIEITVTNRWVDLSLSSGKYVVVANILNEWVIIASECP